MDDVGRVDVLQCLEDLVHDGFRFPLRQGLLLLVVVDVNVHLLHHKVQIVEVVLKRDQNVVQPNDVLVTETWREGGVEDGRGG